MLQPGSRGSKTPSPSPKKDIKDRRRSSSRLSSSKRQTTIGQEKSATKLGSPVSTALGKHGDIRSDTNIPQLIVSAGDAIVKTSVRNKFSHSIYETAAKMYSYLRGEIPSTSLPAFKDEFQKRRAYSVAFATKRCKVFSSLLFSSFSICSSFP